MVPSAVHLEITREADFVRDFSFQSGGLPVDITGFSFFAHVRSKKGDPTLIADLAPAIYDAANGVIRITLTSIQTAAIAAGVYVWDLIMHDAGGTKLDPVIGGRFTVHQPVTVLH
jgi:hypothetical protein